MRHTTSLVMASLLAILPSCVFSSASKLDGMDEQSFVQLSKNVEDTAFLSGFILKDKIDPKTLVVVKAVTSEVVVAIAHGGITIPDSISVLMNLYADSLTKAGVKPDELELIKASVRLVDSAIGNVKVGIAGIGSERTKEIILAVLKGLERGLS